MHASAGFIKLRKITLAQHTHRKQITDYQQNTILTMLTASVRVPVAPKRVVVKSRTTSVRCAATDAVINKTISKDQDKVTPWVRVDVCIGLAKGWLILNV